MVAVAAAAAMAVGGIANIESQARDEDDAHTDAAEADEAGDRFPAGGSPPKSPKREGKSPKGKGKKASKWGAVAKIVVEEEKELTEVEKMEKKIMDRLKVSSSKVRDKLRNLGAFVENHTNRKILDNWNNIELRFKNSAHKKTTIVTNEKGMTYPVSHQALYAATLTGMLCSTKCKVGHRELAAMFTTFGLTDEQILYARKVAALQALIALDVDGMGDPKRTREFKNTLNELLKQDDALVSMNQFVDECFPEDLQERDFEMKRIQAVSWWLVVVFVWVIT
jgi:hypothetical protein